jgi:hypothetical protein
MTKKSGDAKPAAASGNDTGNERQDGPFSRFNLLFGAMFREEWRLHKSFVGSIGSGFFPVVIFFFSVVLAITSPVFLKNIDMSTVLLGLHLAALMYGLFVGALAKIGEQAMTRRLGQVSFLMELPKFHPVSLKLMMSVFYVKDAVFYILYSIIPLVGGIGVSAALGRVTWLGVGILFVTMLLTFLLGMSLSFLLSALALRSGAAAGAAGLGILGLVATVYPLGMFTPGQLLFPLGFWEGLGPLYLLVAAALTLLLSVAAVLAMKERPTAPEERYNSVLLETEGTFSFAGSLSALVAKEWLELRRSRMLGAVFTGFLGPLLGIYAIVWLFQTGLSVVLDFNIVFYGGLIGFFGLMTYSWLTNIEPNEFMNVQPVTVDMVVKAKLVLYFLLTTPAALGYLIAIAVLNGQLAMLPLAATVAMSTMVYVAAITGRMTGIRTNTMLFDAKVLGNFTAAIVPPLLISTLASFWARDEPLISTVILVVMSVNLLAASKFIFDGIPGRWRKEPFGI